MNPPHCALVPLLSTDVCDEAITYSIKGQKTSPRMAVSAGTNDVFTHSVGAQSWYVN